MTRSKLLMFAMFIVFTGCSLGPEHPVTKKDLYNTGIYNRFIIRESPESVLNALNSEGEVVLEAKQKDTPVYLRLLTTKTGLKLTVLER